MPKILGVGRAATSDLLGPAVVQKTLDPENVQAGIVPDESLSSARALIPRDRRHTFSVEYDPGIGAQIEYFTQAHTDTSIFPAGASVNEAKIADRGIPQFGESVNLEAHSTSVTDVVFRVADLEKKASLAIAEKWANRNSGRNAIVRYYVHAADEIDLAADLRHTLVLDAPTWYRGAVEFRCTDIQREAIQQDILEEAAWRQITSLGDNGGEGGDPLGIDDAPTQAGASSNRWIILYGPDPRERLFEHSDAYAEQPGLTVCYVETTEGEIIAIDQAVEIQVDQYSAWQCRIVARGVFRTTPAIVTVQPDGEGVAIDNLPEAGEVIYYVEPAASMLVGLLCRRLLDGRTVPAPHTHGLDAFNAFEDATVDELITKRLRWLDVASLVGADLDFPLFIRNPGKAKLLRFVEEHVLSAMGGVLLPDRHGRLSYRAIPKLTADAPYAGVLSVARGNLDEGQIGPLALETSNRADPIIVKTGYDWRTDTYLDQPAYQRLEAAEIVNGDVSEREFEYKSLGAGFQSDRQRHAIARRKAELLAYPTLTTSARSNLVQSDHDAMSVLRVESDKVRNAHTGLPYPADLGRSFVVTSVNRDYESGEVTYELFGTTGEPQTVADSFLEQHLPDEWYEKYPTLESALRTSTGGAVSLASGELTGGGHTIPPGTYSVLGDLRIRSSFWADVQGFGDRMMLVVRGELEIQAPDPWRGLGPAAGGEGGTKNVPAKAGGRGFVGGGATGQPMRLDLRYRLGPELNSDADKRYERTGKAIVRLGRPVTNHSGAHSGALPELPLALNNGELVGLPARLAGAGGHGAPPHTTLRDSRDGQIVRSGTSGRGTRTTRTLKKGGDGGQGGIAIVYVSRSGGFTGAGGSDTSGGDASARSAFDFEGPVGMPGWPGAAVWLIDGGQQKSLPDPSRFTCRVGAAGEPGTPVADGQTISVESNGRPASPITGPERPLSGVDIWQRMTLVAHVPPPARVASEDRYSGPQDAISEFLSRQRDSQVVIRVTQGRVAPGNGDVADLGIAQEDVDNFDLAEPPAFILTEREGWQQYNWTGTGVALYRLLLDNLRKVDGGDRIISSPTRPPDNVGNLWHDTNTGRIVRLVEGGPPDELVFEQGGQVGENRAPPDFAGFAAGQGEWNVLKSPDTIHRFPPLTILGNAAGGGVVADPTLPAPQGATFVRYSNTSGAVRWTEVPASAVAGTGFRWRLRREGVQDVLRSGRSTTNFELSDLGLDAITFELRLEKEDGTAVGPYVEILRAAESGGSTGGGTGGGGSGERAEWALTERGGGWVRYSSTGGALQWNPPSETDAPGVGYSYTIEQLTPNSRIDLLNGPNDDRGNNNITLENLTANAAHTWRVRIELGAEYGPWLSISGSTA